MVATGHNDVRSFILLVIVTTSYLSSICNCQLIGIERLMQQRLSRQSWSSLENFLARENNTEEAIDVLEQLNKLLFSFKTSSFPTALPFGANISQQCLEDSLFYVESLLYNASNWALRSKFLSLL